MKPIIVPAVFAIMLAGADVNHAQSDDDRVAIEASIEAYVANFNARDAEKLAALWSPEGVYTSRTGGGEITGRESMEMEFATFFSESDTPRLEVWTESIEFISPNVALELGTATMLHPDDVTSENRYRVVYVRRDGQWLIDRVTEDDVIVELSHFDQLQDLEWLIGEWIDDDGEVAVETECKWTENQNYISRTYKVTNLEGVESSGLQIIGWDAKNQQIRSWLFDSSGGFISGIWNQRDDRWTVQSVATLADGGSGSFTSVFRPLDDGRYAWQKINRVLDGQLLPNLEEVIVSRR